MKEGGGEGEGDGGWTGAGAAGGTGAGAEGGAADGTGAGARTWQEAWHNGELKVRVPADQSR